ncbi:MAG: hypothetical protein WCI04_03400 [archaeon]
MDFKNKALFVGLLLCAAFVLFGCTSMSPVCGDSLCSAGEENSCPTDCANTINGNVVVYVSGAYDSEGDLSLEYYNNSYVNYNFSNMVSSTLGNNWSGTTGNNLSISLNQSQAIVKPVPKYGDRQVVISNPKNGDYYFTVRSDDYAYFGSSEKITISEDKNYYVQLELKPSQPVVRVRAVDSVDNLNLSGQGKIEIHLIKYVYTNGETNKEDTMVNSIDFIDGQEMNGLFYLWQPENVPGVQSFFVATVTKDGYSGGEQTLWINNKYNEVSVPLNVASAQTGSLQITIVPGTGTTYADLNRLVGKVLTISNVLPNQSAVIPSDSNVPPNQSAVIPSDLVVTFHGVPYGSYYVSGQTNSAESNEVSKLAPVGIAWWGLLGSEAQNENVPAYLGALVKLSALDSSGNVLDSNKVVISSLCSKYPAGLESCSDLNMSWERYFGSNPFYLPHEIFNENDLNYSMNTQFWMIANYGSEKVTSPKWAYGQGFNSWAITFPSDTNLSFCPAPISRNVVYSPPFSCIVTGNLGTSILRMVTVDSNAQLSVRNPETGMSLKVYRNSRSYVSYDFNLVWNKPLPMIGMGEGFIVQKPGAQQVIISLTP